MLSPLIRQARNRFVSDVDLLGRESFKARRRTLGFSPSSPALRRGKLCLLSKDRLKRAGTGVLCPQMALMFPLAALAFH
jgi:hypothetical protein